MMHDEMVPDDTMDDDTTAGDPQPLRDLVNPRIAVAPVSRDACPTPEALQALASSTGDAPARMLQLEHIATCAACRREFNLLRTAAAAAPLPAATSATSTAASTPTLVLAPRAARRTPARWATLLAAAAVLAVVTSVALDRSPEPDVVRGEAAAPGDLQLLQRIATDTTVAVTWSAVPQATQYRVEVLLYDGSVAFTAETADTIANGPRQRGAIASWRVEATLLDGTIRTVQVRANETR